MKQPSYDVLEGPGHHHTGKVAPNAPVTAENYDVLDVKVHVYYIVGHHLVLISKLPATRGVWVIIPIMRGVIHLMHPIKALQLLLASADDGFRLYPHPSLLHLLYNT
jgi:hypothetical protein